MNELLNLAKDYCIGKNFVVVDKNSSWGGFNCYFYQLEISVIIDPASNINDSKLEFVFNHQYDTEYHYRMKTIEDFKKIIEESIRDR